MPFQCSIPCVGVEIRRGKGYSKVTLPFVTPDLNPLDFSFWAAVSQKMWKNEGKSPNTKREAGKAYLAGVSWIWLPSLNAHGIHLEGKA